MKPRDIQRIARVPHPGFYESVDSYLESTAEWCTGRQIEAGEDYQPLHLRLSEDEISEALSDACDYSNAYLSLAHAYIDAFNRHMSKTLNFPTNLKFESMNSPRKYNFATDRIYATIPLTTAYLLLRQARKNDYERLSGAVRGLFPSRDGFISHYPNRLASWLVKPLRDWDHNELYALIIAEAGFDTADPDLELYYDVTDRQDDFDQAVDWPAYEARIAELRKEKLEAWQAEHSEEPEPYRCPNTLELPL